jgi:hypothetical protein
VRGGRRAVLRRQQALCMKAKSARLMRVFASAVDAEELLITLSILRRLFEKKAWPHFTYRR